MNSLQDLVTSAVEEPLVPTLAPPLQIFDAGLSLHFDDLETLYRELPEKIRSASPSEVPYIVSQAAGYLNRSRSQREYRALLLAATYAQEPSETILQELSEWRDSVLEWIEGERITRAENAAIGSGDLQISFLEEFFGDDLAKELASITSLKEATTKRWVRGHFSTSWSRHEKVRMLAKIFYTFTYHQGLDRDAALVAYRSPWQGGSSPETIMHGGRGLYSTEIRDLLASLS